MEGITVDGWNRSGFERARDRKSGWSGRVAGAEASDRLETFAVLLGLGLVMVWEWANPHPARSERRPGEPARAPGRSPSDALLADGPSARQSRRLS